MTTQDSQKGGNKTPPFLPLSTNNLTSKHNNMKTYSIEKQENKFLETVVYHLVEREIINGKIYIDYEYFVHKDEKRVQSKCRLMNALQKLNK